jgi:hypothetical protein
VTGLPELLRDLADEAPAMTVPSGLFDRARRRRRARWAMAATAVVVLLLSGYGLSLAGLGAGRDSARVAAGSPGLPATVFDPPQWTQPFAGSPNGPASVVFWGPAVPDQAFGGGGSVPTAIVGLAHDTYRVVYPAQPSLELSPDGTTLLVARESGSTYRTDAVDLATGRTRPVAAGRMPIGWSTDGRYALVGITDRWSHPGLATVNDLTLDVLAWPSAQVVWSVRIGRPDPVEGESTYLVALSPDATMLATSTSHELRVYRRDGAQGGTGGVLVWHRPLDGFDILAGPAAWRPDGRLAVLRRSTCSGCPRQQGWSDPSDWRLAYVDAATGDPLPDPGYPRATGAFSFSIVAWRGETAYAVTRASPADDASKIQASLIRLAPDSAGPQRVLTVRDGISDLNVATDYLDTIRPAGSPEFGFSLSQAAGMVVPYTQLLVLVVVIGFAVWWTRRSRTRLRPVPPAP